MISLWSSLSSTNLLSAQMLLRSLSRSALCPIRGNSLTKKLKSLKKLKRLNPRKKSHNL